MAEKDEKKQQPKEPNAIQKFWRETIGELRKVTWPTWQEARHLTGIVLIVLFAMSALLGLLDFIFSWLITHLMA